MADVEIQLAFESVDESGGMNTDAVRRQITTSSREEWMRLASETWDWFHRRQEDHRPMCPECMCTVGHKMDCGTGRGGTDTRKRGRR